MSADTEHAESSSQATRRGLLATAAGLLVYGLGWLSSGVAAQVTPSGDVANPSEPAANIYTQRVHIVDQSDPSSPDDGTLWYNSGA